MQLAKVMAERFTRLRDVQSKTCEPGGAVDNARALHSRMLDDAGEAMPLTISKFIGLTQDGGIAARLKAELIFFANKDP